MSGSERDIVEQVARALFEVEHRGLAGSVGAPIARWEEETQDQNKREYWFISARAARAAYERLRSPSLSDRNSVLEEAAKECDKAVSALSDLTDTAAECAKALAQDIADNIRALRTPAEPVLPGAEGVGISPSSPEQGVREALGKLVRARDALDKANGSGTGRAIERAQRHVHLAWDNARAALNSSPSPSPTEALFASLAHGDEQHRTWLKAAINAHFAGEPIPPPVLGKTREEAKEAAYNLGYAAGRRRPPSSQGAVLREALETAARIVHDTFKRDMDQGYRTRDKEFAVDLLGRALSSSQGEGER